VKPDKQNQEAEIKGELEHLQARVLELERKQAKEVESEQALRESEALLRQITANYPSSYMSIVEKDLTIGFTSGQEFKKQNLSPDDYVGLTLEQVFGEQAPVVREYYLRTFGGEETSFELYVNNQYQRYKTVPLPNGGSGIERILVVVENVTERKQAQAALEQRTHELGERVKELNCLYGISSLIETPDIMLDEILQGTVDLISPAWQFPAITCARIIFREWVLTSKRFEETQWQQTSPLVMHGKRVGGIQVYYLDEKPEADEGPFLKEERNLLNAIAERLGRVAERFKAEEELEKLATTDPLTGLFNRRHFFNLTEKELERSKRYGHPLSCMMFDIDDFKDVNDTYGHLFGDRVLQEVTQYCQASLRQIDIFARFGGDEFIRPYHGLI